MCGIFFYRQTTPISTEKSEAIFRAIALLTHRGPEALKCERIDDRTVVGFTFLPIMTGNETQGLQPFRYGDWILICNGEIYNHRELLPGATTPGAIASVTPGAIASATTGAIASATTGAIASATTGAIASATTGAIASDVEAIYYAFEKYGESHFMDYLNGEFAFVLYNTRTHQLIVRRDPYGVRALHGAENEHAFAYASEMKALYPLFDPSEISHIVPSANTFRGCAAGPTIKPGKILLEEALYRRVRPENMHRPYAFLLSGGLDSSILCALAQRMSACLLRTFCLSIGDDDGTDLRFARKLAAHYGIHHTEVIISVEDALAVIPDVVKTVETFDVTTIRASTGQYLVCQYIKKHHPEICALIVGEGADELFGGYVYSLRAPNQAALAEDSRRLLSQLYRFDCKRVDMCVSRFGMEARTPFLDLEFAGVMECDPGRFQFDKMQSSGLTKVWLRQQFGDILPKALAERKKEAFSDGVMAHTHRENSWYGAIQAHTASLGLTEKEWYKQLFDEHYKGCDHLVPEYWMPRWTGGGDDPSALVYME